MNFIRTLRLATCAATIALLAACAHPINLEATQLPERDSAKVAARKVGYVMTDADRAKEVTTPGGGGDKVKYQPYRDMEKALRAALRAVYDDVTVVKSAGDSAALKDAGVTLVFSPTITTTSYSPSAFTWPPTQFTAEISCTVTDPLGAVVGTVTAVGNGAAEFSEFKSDFSLSARRAVGDAAEKLAQQIRADARLR